MVLSELRRRDRKPHVVHWLREVRPSDLFLSVVTIGEVERGIRKQQRQDPDFAKRLTDWLETVLIHYRDRILPIDVQVVRRWGEMSDRLRHGGADLLIAATALEHGLSVVTRNVSHFDRTGVPLINPFEPTAP
ncbi:MAG: type II toxin-antitoxin system VapC family toxin [Magnetococcales bacterium]|nr:type II toxin-antitoxin system VapC family toxin [Magnetococcales bacterium]MBF0156313.1 type II toxin-antitoxin system VapC family toxin [Magnetococcales bacterium]